MSQGPHPFSAIDAATVRYGAERQLQPSPVPTAVSSSEIDALPACSNATAKKGDKLWEVSNTLFVVNEAIKAGRTLYGKKLTSVRDFFEAVDVDGDGHLTVGELRKAFTRLGLGLSQNMVEDIIMSIDLDSGGKVEYEELASSLREHTEYVKPDYQESAGGIERHGEDEEDLSDTEIALQTLYLFVKRNMIKLTGIFARFDSSGDGSLSRDEFVHGLQSIKSPLTREQMDSVFDHIDTEGDDDIELAEFMEALHAADPSRRKRRKAMMKI